MMTTSTLDLGQFGSKLGQSLMGILGGDNFQEGYNKGAGHLGDMMAKQAQAGLYNAKADTERQRAQYQRPEFGNQLAAAMAGLVGDQPAQMEQYQTKGNWGTREFAPDSYDAQDLGSVLGQNKNEAARPDWATPEKIGAYQQGRAAHMMNLAGTGDTNANQMADAYAGLRKQGGIDRSMADPRFAARFGQAQAAAAGKPLVDNAGGDAIFNQFTGEQAPLTQHEAQAMVPLFGKLFGTPHQVAGDNVDGYQIVPVSGDVGVDASGQFVRAATTPSAPAFNTDYARTLGLDDQKMALLGELASGDPKTARMVAAGVIRQALRPAPAEKLPADYAAFQREKADGSIPRNTTYTDWKRANSRAGATSISNVMPSAAAESAGKKEGFEIGEQAAAIENKYSALDSVREARETLAKGIYAGAYGDFKKMMAKGTLGLIGDRQKAINTEEFMSYVGNTVVPRLKEFGGNDSNEEMKYLKSIMGGEISMEPESIARILESAERKIQRGIERLQRQRGALQDGRMPDMGPGPSREKPKPAAQKMSTEDRRASVLAARKAITQGKDKGEIIRRLEAAGITDHGIK